MAWLAAIGTLLQIIVMVLKWWFEQDSVKKAKVQLLVKDVENAKDASSITAMFDAINRL